MGEDSDVSYQPESEDGGGDKDGDRGEDWDGDGAEVGVRNEN